jgi:hypothetical protein
VGNGRGINSSKCTRAAPDFGRGPDRLQSPS